MKKTLVALATGIIVGGATLGPVAATASDNATLRQRVRYLEARVDNICVKLTSQYTVDQGLC